MTSGISMKSYVELGKMLDAAEARATAAEVRVKELLHPLGRESYSCPRCGVTYGMDASLPNSEWKAITDGTPYENSTLCLWCIDALAAERGVKFTVWLYFVGIAGQSALYDSESPDKRWVELRDEALADRDAYREALRTVAAALRAMHNETSAWEGELLFILKQNAADALALPIVAAGDNHIWQVASD